MTTLTAMRGFPGSGKSTIARCLAQHTGAVVVGRDYLRKQLYGTLNITNDEEAAVTIAEQAQVKMLLHAGIDVIVDDMNVNSRYLKNWAKVARDNGAEFVVHDVPTSVDTCIRRDANKQRLDDGKTVGEKVILKIAKRFPIEKWPTITIKPKPTYELVPYEAKPNSPKAIIVDIDGTLAHMTSRSPFDYSRVSEDIVDETIKDIVNREYKSGNIVIICSGRDHSCRGQTVDWLHTNGIAYDWLFMRDGNDKDDNGNKVADWIVKAKIFDDKIRDSFNVKYVLDDRQIVVDTWRALGLKCLQVAPGDF